MNNHRDAPWTDDEVASLNAYQQCGYWYPFTSYKDSNVNLIATPAGWVEKPGGWVVQKWAHKSMTDWSWRLPEQEALRKALVRDPESSGGG